MSDLNKKNINYGALNRFYQDLKSHDLSVLNDRIDNIDVPEYTAGDGIAIDSSSMTISCTVKPIADVSVLPNAEANKDSVLRLEGDKQVYISKILNTPYLLDEYDNKYLYDGLYTIQCNNGNTQQYIWWQVEREDDENVGYITSKNPYENDFSETLVMYNMMDNDEVVDRSNHTIQSPMSTSFYTPSDAYTDLTLFKYQWQRVVTEDELNGIGDAFQTLEARIYALEHPTTVE